MPAPPLALTPSTHLGIDSSLCGVPVRLESGLAEVELATVPAMAADAQGLVHGGFVFGAADYAAMLAVNHPHVVLGGAEVRLHAPVRVAEVVRAEARLVATEGRKRRVEVTARVGERVVLSGMMTCFVLDRHVLAAEGGEP